MANKTIEIEVKVKGIQEINNELKTLKNNLDATTDPSTFEKLNKQVEELTEEMKKTGKAVDAVEKNTKVLSKGFKAAGLALKAMGIGLAIEAFNILKDVFMSNQKVADTLSTGLKFLKNVFNDLFSFIEKNIGPVTKYFKGIFEDPQKALSDFGDAIKENLIERFESFLDTLGLVASSIKKIFEGDFKGAWDTAKKAGKESIDVLTGVNNTFDKSVKIISDVTDAIGDYVSSTWDAAAAQVALENSVKLAMARNAGLIEQYDILAEKQRQIRDDETLSIEDRIKANDELKVVLERQASLMAANALLAVQAAKNTLAENNSIENQVALIEAQNEVKAIQAQITGLLSEQKVNEIALNKELIELNNLAIEGDNNRIISSNKFATSLIKNTIDRLAAERLAIQEEYKIELERLENKKALYKEGTLANAEAQQEILDLKLAFDQSLISNDIASEEERTAIAKANAEARTALALAELEAKKNALNTGLEILAGFAGKNKTLAVSILAIQKGLAIADVIIGAAKSIALAKANLAAIPFILPPGVPNPAWFAQAAATSKGIITTKIGAATSIASILASGIEGVKTITAGSGSSSPASSTPAAGSSAPSAPTAPAFNLFGSSSGTSNEASSSGTVSATPVNQQPVFRVQAIVSETEMTDTQARVARMQASAEL